MSDAVIRQATRDDLPALLELYAQPSFNGGAVDLEKAGSIYETISTYPNYHIHVAEQDGAVIGTLCLIVIDNIAARGMPCAIIESVVMQADRQGSGIGRQMLLHAMQEAAKLGAYKVALYTSSPHDYVHRFYEALGFERHGISYQLDLKEFS